MDKYTAAPHDLKVSPTDILLIAEKAREDKKAGNNVINASIGQFLNDDKTLGGVAPVKESLAINIPKNLGYPQMFGSPEYKTEVLKWLFKDRYEEVIKDYEIPFGATLGGTGALSIAFKTYLAPSDEVLLPSIMWNNYKLVAAQAGLVHSTYRLFNDEKKFDIDGLVASLAALSKRQKHLLAVINDPCENPTGCSLTLNEYVELFDKIDALNLESLVLVFDIAYLDCGTPINQVGLVFQALLAKPHKFLPVFAFSCSKTFGIYGLRLGALFALTHDKDVAKHFLNSFGSIARGTYSCPDGAAMEAIVAMLKDPKASISARKEIEANAQKVQERGLYLAKKLTAANIPFFPYQAGFFLTFLVEDAFAVYDYLAERHIYVVPLNDTMVRIAVSGLTLPEIDTLVATVEEALKA